MWFNNVGHQMKTKKLAEAAEPCACCMLNAHEPVNANEFLIEEQGALLCVGKNGTVFTDIVAPLQDGSFNTPTLFLGHVEPVEGDRRRRGWHAPPPLVVWRGKEDVGKMTHTYGPVV